MLANRMIFRRLIVAAALSVLLFVASAAAALVKDSIENSGISGTDATVYVSHGPGGATIPLGTEVDQQDDDIPLGVHFAGGADSLVGVAMVTSGILIGSAALALGSTKKN